MPSVSSSFAFLPEETVKQGFVRLLGQLMVEARRPPDETASESVHEMRVLIKRVRALLWFANPTLPALKLEQAKSQLRKASHLLAPQRDLAVMKSVLKKLSHKTSNLSDKKTLIAVSQNQDQRQADNKKSAQSLQKAIAILRKTIKQIEHVAKTKSQWPSPSARLAKAFRATQKAERKALRHEEPAQFHDWRKKAKRLLYQLQMMQTVPGKRIIKQVDKLQEKLGNYHDSVIVQDRLKRNCPDNMPQLIARYCVKFLDKRKKRLCKKARTLARHLELK